MTYRGSTVESGDREASALGKWARVALRIRVIVAVMSFVAVIVMFLLLHYSERSYGGGSNLVIVAPDLLLSVVIAGTYHGWIHGARARVAAREAARLGLEEDALLKRLRMIA